MDAAILILTAVKAWRENRERKQRAAADEDERKMISATSA